MVSIRFDFCNVLAYFVLRKISREKVLLSNKNIFKIYFKVLKNVEREKYENKIISLQEFLKRKNYLQ